MTWQFHYKPPVFPLAALRDTRRLTHNGVPHDGQR
ncbi:MAG: hypothetical protein GAK37_02925 [Pseudomonas sp.]|nr:MAG: hypothetical protein GAK37_02925 [Pseudomonas sp.]